MGLFRKIKIGATIFRDEGFKPLIFTIITELRLPILLKSKSKWEAGIHSELQHWEKWIQSKGLNFPEDFNRRVDRDSMLQPEFIDLLPSLDCIEILDVGAGPLTAIGKKCEGKKIIITAVDSLADVYNRMLEKYNIEPIVKTQKIDAERLTDVFTEDKFDLVIALNAIDHTYNPEEAILQMLKVVKSGSFVFLRHTLDEGEAQDYSGFHQWNFSMSTSGDFLIKSKTETINMTKKYSEICEISCEIVNLLNMDKLVTKIQKKLENNFHNSVSETY